MNMNIVDNHSSTGQNRPVQYAVVNDTINKRDVNKNVMISKNILKYRRSSFESKHESCAGVCAFAVFTGIVMTIGIIIICVTSPKNTNKICRLNFNQTADRHIGYDSRPQHIVVGDLNNDHNLDLVVANSGTDKIGLFLGNGNGTFASQITYSTGLGSYPLSVGVGDFVKDNQLDIVVANYGTNNIGLFFGYGNGSFASQQTFSLSNSRPLFLVVDDINNDNQPDIVVANYGTSNVVILLGYPDGSFKLEMIFDMGYDSIPYSLMVKDFDNNNHLDIAIVNYGTDNLVILLSNGNGSFINRKYSTGRNSHPCSVAVGDLDTDNIVDIVVANFGTDSIGIFFGNGNGTFRDMIPYQTGSGSRPQFIAVGNFNNDAMLDIVVVNAANNSLLVFKGKRNGIFSVLLTYSTGFNSNPCAIAIDDFDKDNRSDIAIANNGTGTILVLTAYGFYPKPNRTMYTTGKGSSPFSVVLNNLNNDTYLDIIVANADTNNVGIFLGLGNGTFKEQVIYNMENNSETYFATTGDFNNDQHVDIVVVLHAINKIHILLGNGDGTFRDGDTYSTEDNSQPYTAVVGDFNNDGHLDIITSNYWIGNIGLFFGNGNGTFMAMVPLLSESGVYPKCIDIGDLNGDNQLDIIAADASNGFGILTLLGYGNGSFCDPIWTSTDEDPVNCFSIADLNKDKKSDMIYSSALSNSIGVLHGYGNGSFGSITRYPTGRGSEPWFIALGDLNNDNWTDIGVGNAYDSDIGIFLTLINGSFAPQITFKTGFGSVPYALAFGDLNDDDQLDIVVGNADVSNVLVFLMDFASTFANETSYSTGSGPHPYSIIVTDLNHDNHEEIIVANAVSNNIKILFDYQHGFFVNTITYSTGFGSHPQYVTAADFNKDNQLDIVVANSWKDNIYVFLGVGNKTFNAPLIYSTGSGSAPNSITVADFNKDSWIDIAVANRYGDNVGIFLGFDYSTFTEETILIPGLLPRPTHMAVGDFNNDSRWDIVVVNTGTNNIGIYLGYGNGTFATQITLRTNSTSEPIFVAVGDFNNDHQSDIVVANYNSDTIDILLGYGNGSFDYQKTSRTININSPISIAVGDFNNDSCLDIVVASDRYDELSIVLGDGDGWFHMPRIHYLSAGSFPVSVVVNDLNNDYILDIVVANYNGNNIGLLLGNGDGTCKDKSTLSTGIASGPYSIATGDINNDHWIDIVVANQNSKTIGVFFGYGNGRFSSQKTFSTGPQSYLTSICLDKLNNDTLLDIVVSDQGTGDANIAILFGLGDGNFTSIKTYPIDYNSMPTSIVTGNFNTDGLVDLAVCNSNRHSITIMLRDKNEPFATQTSFSTGSNSRPQSVTVGYLNNDDVLDIAVANFGTDNIGIFLGYGNGSFAPQEIYPINNNSQPISIATGDFDNDGKADIVVANFLADNINIYFGYDNGTFISLKTYATGISSAPFDVAVADLNKDHYLDIIVANWAINNVLVFVGMGNRSFFELGPYTMGYNAHPQSITAGDFNKDNLTDIAIANYGADYIEILEQIC